MTADEAAIAAALEHPETPLLRAVGSNDPFQLEPANLPKVPDVPKRPAARAAAKPRPPADRAALDAAEAVLRKLDDDRKREEADFRRRQDEFDAEKAAAQRNYVEGRKAATAAVVDARQAYRKAGGEG